MHLRQQEAETHLEEAASTLGRDEEHEYLRNRLRQQEAETHDLRNRLCRQEAEMHEYLRLFIEINEKRDQLRKQWLAPDPTSEAETVAGEGWEDAHERTNGLAEATAVREEDRFPGEEHVRGRSRSRYRKFSEVNEKEDKLRKQGLAPDPTSEPRFCACNLAICVCWNIVNDDAHIREVEEPHGLGV